MLIEKSEKPQPDVVKIKRNFRLRITILPNRLQSQSFPLSLYHDNVFQCLEFGTTILLCFASRSRRYFKYLFTKWFTKVWMPLQKNKSKLVLHPYMKNRYTKHSKWNLAQNSIYDLPEYLLSVTQTQNLFWLWWSLTLPFSFNYYFIWLLKTGCPRFTTSRATSIPLQFSFLCATGKPQMFTYLSAKYSRNRCTVYFSSPLCK